MAVGTHIVLHRYVVIKYHCTNTTLIPSHVLRPSELSLFFITASKSLGHEHPLGQILALVLPEPP